MKIREWFDAKNPYAFQGMAENLLEATRKEYWRPDEATILEIATAYTQSVARYGLREPGEVNEKLAFFVARTLNAPGPDTNAGKSAQALLAQYKQITAARGEEIKAKKTEPVEGQKMEPVTPAPEPGRGFPWLYFLVGAAAVLLFMLGLWRRRGGPR